MERHGKRAVITYRRNTKNVPIDGIWISPSLEIRASGYFAFDEIFQGTDHHTVWVDLAYTMAFGHNMAPIVKPQARRLQCKDPRLVANFIRKYEEFIKKHKLLDRALALEANGTYPPTIDLQQEYQEIDQLWYKGVEEAERKCRKLRMGNVGFSPVIQLAMRQIRACSLLVKKKKGLKVSSRLLSRSLKKAGIDIHNRAMGLKYLEEQMLQSHKYYYSVKKNHGPLRETALDSFARAVAEKEGISKASAIKAIKLREEQRRTARKIKHIRGKLSTGTTTLVTVQLPSGELQDIVDKSSIEQAIMNENKSKYQQSFQIPFMRPPLITDFGFLGIGRYSAEVLNGLYKPPNNISPCTKMYLQQLAYPNKICNTSLQMPIIQVEDYRRYWRRAKEHTSSYPGAIDFSTLKAGAHSELISTFDCVMTRLPISTGFHPKDGVNALM